MEPMLLVPSRRKLIGPGAALGLFAAMFATTGDRSLSEDWPVVALFLAFAAVLLWLSLPGGAYIRLSESGLELKFTWWKHFVPWHDIESCRIKGRFGGKMLLVKRIRRYGVSLLRHLLSWRSYQVPDIFELGPERLAEEIERRRAEFHRIDQNSPATA